MSANLERAIQEEVRELTDDQQRQVIAFLESFKPANKSTRRYSFIGIARSGNGLLSTQAESILLM